MRSIFGWSYPPGCSGPPDEPEDCWVCGAANLEHCICPECPVCEAIGDLECYKNHGLIYSFAQLRGQASREEINRREAEAESKFFEQWEEAEHV